MDYFFVVHDVASKNILEAKRQQYARVDENIFFVVGDFAIKDKIEKKIFENLAIYSRKKDQTIVVFLIGLPAQHAINLRRTMPALLVTSTQNDLESRSSIAKVIGFVQSEAAKIRRLLEALRKEIQERDSKTPLLLPLNNFNSAPLKDFVTQIQDFRASIPDYTVPIRKAVDDFVTKHLKIGSEGKKTFFIGGRSIRFIAPSKAGARHAHAQSVDPPHVLQCAINGYFRLGVRYDPSFHYDCSINSGQIGGVFENCHAGADNMKPSDYLNIAPNDNVRRA